MALYLKMFVKSYSIIVPNFKFVSQSARFGQNFTPTTPTTILYLTWIELMATEVVGILHLLKTSSL